MDPLTQSTFGGIFAQTVLSKDKLIYSSIIGILAGLSPDLDILIRSSSDPLLKLEYHRQFSHSLIFIPIGAFGVSLLTHLIFRHKLSFFQNYISSFFGYATHGLLDACTSYGTQLFWPFSNHRYSWNNISIIDPILTIPILILFVFSILYKNKLFSFLAIIWIFLYLGFGVIKKNQALNAAKSLIDFRGHTYQKLTVKPSFGNIFLWKIIYLYNDNYFVDAVNLIAEPKFCFGSNLPKFHKEKFYKFLKNDNLQYIDIQRFEWFSQGYIAYDKKKRMIVDIRYSIIPNDVRSLWGIRINSDKDYNGHVNWINDRETTKSQRQILIDMILGNKCKKYF